MAAGLGESGPPSQAGLGMIPEPQNAAHPPQSADHTLVSPPVDPIPPRHEAERGRSGLSTSPLVACAIVLALLYLAREVLVPVALAAMLSLLVAPLVRRLRRLGLPATPAVLTAVGSLCAGVAALTVMLAVQLVDMTASLPQYESSIRAKVATVKELTVDRLDSLQGTAGRLFKHLSEPERPAPGRGATSRLKTNPSGERVQVEVYQPPPTSLSVLTHLATSLWEPLATAGIVLIVMLFTLLEHESLRDRLLRLIGGHDLRASTEVLNDVGERLSRYFVSQFAVNFGVGAVVWLGLWAIDLPHAMLWGVLTALMRFVPYIGAMIAMVPAVLLGAAVEPGWTLMLLTLATFAVIEVLAAQVVEPLLYGHSTGLSPLSVVIATIFWSALWGPVGLLLATPMTLCLLVAGRYVPSLKFLDILLGDGPSLTRPQRFYQRTLSGDAHDLIAQARAYLKKKSFASYCDNIVLPALQLAARDHELGLITPEQSQRMQKVVVDVISALDGSPRRRRPRNEAHTVLDLSSPGVALRRQREAEMGRWQGPLSVPTGSLNLCIGQGGIGDEMMTELLTRALRDAGLDARHMSITDTDEVPPEARTESVARVFIQSGESQAATQTLVLQLQQDLPQASLIQVQLPAWVTGQAKHSPAPPGVVVVESFRDAVSCALEAGQAQRGSKARD